MPLNFGKIIVDSVEQCLMVLPKEYFTQTGGAWVLQNMLTQQDEIMEYALDMIMKHAETRNVEAKK